MSRRAMHIFVMSSSDPPRIWRSALSNACAKKVSSDPRKEWGIHGAVAGAASASGAELWWVHHAPKSERLFKKLSSIGASVGGLERRYI